MRVLNELAPKAKARRFRTLLPMIEAGVRHGDIIHALASEGLSPPENTYFTYLRRYRRNRSRAGWQEARASSTPTQGGENTARRPPTFDYDPRGIPDLLK